MKIEPSSNARAIDDFLNGNCTITPDLMDVMVAHGFSGNATSLMMQQAVDWGRTMQSHDVPIEAVAEILLQFVAAGMKSYIEGTKVHTVNYTENGRVAAVVRGNHMGYVL